MVFNQEDINTTAALSAEAVAVIVANKLQLPLSIGESDKIFDVVQEILENNTLSELHYTNHF